MPRTLTRWALAGALVLAGSALGCDEEATPRPTSPEERPAAAAPGPVDAPAPPVTAGQRTMHDRYEAVELIRDAIIRGDVDAAKAAAQTLGPAGARRMPERAATLRDAVPAAARALVAATDLRETGRAYGALVERCGACHQITGSEFSFDDPPLPAGTDLGAHMRRHRWAVDRMWEALVVASADRFDAGATALAEAPLTGDAPPDTEDPPGLSALAERVHSRARDAASAADMPARAAIYGDLLATCAECHRHFAELDRQGLR